MEKQFWNERYANKEFVYGEQPNNFFKHQFDTIKHTGKILFPCEGEGRNAVYAATKNWQVSAFDLSEEGKNKAMQLAEKNKVQIDYIVQSFGSLPYKENQFDVIVLIFAHLPETHRHQYYTELIHYLKPGGVIILESFSKQHAANQASNPKAGGPRNIEMLYSIEDAKKDFTGFDIQYLQEEDIELSEGFYHIGKASVVRFVGRKK